MAKELVEQDDLDLGIDVSDIMMILMMFIMMSMVAAARQTSQATQAQAYTGLTDTRVLSAIPQSRWINLLSSPPYTPWISASFHNDGWTEHGVHYDWSVFIGINNPDELHEIASGEDYQVDMSGGARRIELIFYKTDPGQKASVRAVGKY